MPNYYDQILSMLLGSGEYGGNQQALARADASVAEDDRFKSLTKRKRKLGKNERMPEGAYALANYPGLSSAVDWAKTGNLPGGNASIGMWLKEQNDMALRDANSKKRKEWAAFQDQFTGRW